MPLLPDVFDNVLESLIVVQTSLATPWRPFLQALLSPHLDNLICVGLLHPPAAILPASLNDNKERIVEIDWTSAVPYYENPAFNNKRGDLNDVVLGALSRAPLGAVTLIVDSVETLCVDLSSVSAAYNCLKVWYTALTMRHSPARMILPISLHSPLLPRIISTAFSPTLIHLTLHPPKLLHHLAVAHLSPAPPDPRFWALLSTARTDTQAEQLVWGNDGNGWSDADIVVEVLIRRARGRRFEHAIEGWRSTGPCELTELSELRNVWSGSTQVRGAEPTTDPTHGASFNLILTDAQQRARAQIPLPYVHSSTEETAQKSTLPPPLGTILYDPDSADDLDDDDPDEDLDI